MVKVKALPPFESFSKVPKYQQLVNTIIANVENGSLKNGDRLPSINEASEEYYLSRDTVERAYSELYRLGVITSVNRRGYFISGKPARLVTKVLFLVGEITDYNKTIYNAFLRAFGKNANVDIFTYNYKKSLFCETLHNHLGDYHYYVVMPHLIEEDPDVLRCLRLISGERLVLLDQLFDGVKNAASGLYFDPSLEMYRLLKTCEKALSRYEMINLVLSNEEYFDAEMISGFCQFCEDKGFDYQILDGMEGETIEHHQAYLTVDDIDLVNIIQQTQQANWHLGEDVGVVSMQDSNFKSILAGGITVFTNNPQKMGTRLAELIREGKKQQDYLPMEIIWRKSL
ncbi:MAG: GntR family transcriptional regulator [Spirosomataceae bacterium]